MKIKTEVLQNSVSKAVKGAGLNKLLPLTNMISITVEDGVMELATTDMTNYLYIKEDIGVSNPLQVVIEIETFAKLVSRLSCEYVSLELEDSCLKVKADSGEYSIEIPLDENGNPIKFTDKKFVTDKPAWIIKTAAVRDILQVCKPALAITLEAPCYVNYYVGNGVISTDSYKIAYLNTNILPETALISSQLMNLLDVIQDAEIKYYERDNEMMFVTDKCSVYGVKAFGLEDYAHEAIKGLIEMPFEYSCKVNKNALIAALDRVSLFVGAYDNKAVKLSFTPDHLIIASKANTAEETVEIINESAEVFDCVIDGEMLLAQIKANPADILNIEYGQAASIKIVNDNITQVISLMES